MAESEPVIIKLSVNGTQTWVRQSEEGVTSHVGRIILKTTPSPAATVPQNLSPTSGGQAMSKGIDRIGNHEST